MAQIKAGIARLSIVNLSSLTSLLLQRMTGNPNFPNPTPSMEDLDMVYRQYVKLMIDAEDRGKTAVYLRNEKAKELRAMLRRLVAYVTLIADGDESIIRSSGFDIRNEPTPKRKLEKPENLKVKRSDNKGIVELKWEPVNML